MNPSPQENPVRAVMRGQDRAARMGASNADGFMKFENMQLCIYLHGCVVFIISDQDFHEETMDIIST